MTIGEWLSQATQTLEVAGTTTARLDAELLLAHVLQQNRPYVHAHAEQSLSQPAQDNLNALLQQRQARTPLAYLLGYKEFYGRAFVVTPAVLIPRPETELLVKMALELPLQPADRVLDVGTGSGAIAITLALERPNLAVHARDLSAAALAVAQQNAAKLGAQTHFAEQNLLEGETHGPFVLIVANLPYVDRGWQRSPETNHEPQLALFANDIGLELIKKLVRQSPKNLTAQGYLLLEADPRQHQAIVEFAHQYDFLLRRQAGFGLLLQRSAATN